MQETVTKGWHYYNYSAALQIGSFFIEKQQKNLYFVEKKLGF
jgi:hypothetical protein